MTDRRFGEKKIVRFLNKLPLCFILTVLMGNQFWLVTMVTMIVKRADAFKKKTSGRTKKRPAGRFLEKRPAGYVF